MGRSGIDIQCPSGQSQAPPSVEVGGRVRGPVSADAKSQVHDGLNLRSCGAVQVPTFAQWHVASPRLAIDF